MNAAFKIAEEIPRTGKLYECDRKVAAVLIAADGKFIAAARNANAKNRTRHAEVNLVQGLRTEHGKSLPRGSKIYVTLKCCRMCAAAIWCDAEDIRSLHVYYGEDDPGPNARETILARNGLLSALPPAQELNPIVT